ncbi:MAG: TolC family protein [Gemmatimonadetes bacterium]|nr:TolC family protein [Gemmatimonadota bacterium]
MRRTALVALALSLAGPAVAQEPAAPPLTLERALELARAHAPALPVAAGRVLLAAGAARERAVPGNPVLDLRQENVNGPGSLDRFATVTLPLDLTFRRSALRAAGRAQVAAAQADSASTLREVERSVATLYWRSALADALVEAAAAQDAALEEIAAFEATRLREGAVAEGVALRARLEVERARLALARSRAEAQRAHAALAEAIGLPPDQVPHAVPLAPPAAATDGAGGQAAATTAPPLPPLDVAVERALAARPEVEAARRRVEAAHRGLAAEWRGTLPDVGVQLGARRTGTAAAGAVVGFAVGLPLRDRGEAARARARAEVAIAEAELAAVRRRVEAEVASALDVYRRLLEAAPAERADLAARGAEIARIAQAAYREGAISQVEVLDAQRAHADARATAAAWAAELAIARIELNHALGAPIDEENR